jgi:tripartite-type tricarboxylate transporter receptor subunit TctC
MTQLRIALAALACAVTFAVAPVAAQIGGKPIRIVTTFAPGGGQDILARSFSNELGAALGQPLIVESRAGGGGTVGTLSVIRSGADGQTLMIAGASHIIRVLLSSKPAYDPVRDFSGVAHIGTLTQVMLISGSMPARTIPEFAAYVKANPGKLNYASAGNGSSTHLSMAYLLSVAGIDMLHVPFKSNAEQMTDLLGGRVHAVHLPITSAVAYAKDERVRLIAVTSHERSKFMPALPTIGESYPGYVYESWLGLLAPTGTPRAVVDRINAEMAKVLADPAVRERIEKLGIEPRAMSPDDFDKVLRSDYDRLAKIVKLSGATIE